MTAAQQQLERAPWTIWVDTCSLIDFDTTISLVKNASRGQVASTRVLMRDAAWMGVALDKRSEISVTAGYEVSTKLDKEATPGTQDGLWTHIIAHVVRDYVCPNWTVRHTYEGDVTDTTLSDTEINDRHDDFMIDVARRESKQLVTTDGGAYKKAKRLGVDVMKPREYAAKVISFDEARHLFLTRFDRGSLMLLARLAARGERPGNAPENLRITRDAYAWILS